MINRQADQKAGRIILGAFAGGLGAGWMSWAIGVSAMGQPMMVFESGITGGIVYGIASGVARASQTEEAIARGVELAELGGDYDKVWGQSVTVCGCIIGLVSLIGRGQLLGTVLATTGATSMMLLALRRETKRAIAAMPAIAGAVVENPVIEDLEAGNLRYLSPQRNLLFNAAMRRKENPISGIEELLNKLKELKRMDDGEFEIFIENSIDDYSLFCPISKYLMRDPVSIDTGHTFERKEIENWLKNNNTNPMTGLVLDSKRLIPNLAMRNLILERLNKILIDINDLSPKERKMTL